MYSYLMEKPDYSSPALPNSDAQRRRAKLAAPLRGWFGAVLRRWQQQRMIVALEALDDRLLRDIGLTRAGIRKAVLDHEASDPDLAPPAFSPARTQAYPLAA